MNEKYVFDFYNLYIPKGKKYINKNLGINITPLKFAEEFEKSRKTFSKPYYRGYWKTAKCSITAKNEYDAKKIAERLEFLYSFAQNRSISFFGLYKYVSGKKFTQIESKLLESRKNGFSDLLYGIRTKDSFFTRDLTSFLDTALNSLYSSKKDDLEDILTTIHAYLISKSDMVIELKFLISWIALEKLANKHTPISKENLFSKIELDKIKKAIVTVLDTELKDDRRLVFLKKSLSKNYLYQNTTNTRQKVISYLKSLDVDLDQKKLTKLWNIRVKLVHHLNSNKLKNKPQYLFYLQTIMENVIFRLLNIDKNLQKTFLLNQYNKGEL